MECNICMNPISREFLDHDAYAYCKICTFVCCLDCNVECEKSKIFKCPQCRNHTIDGYFAFILNCTYDAILSGLFQKYIRFMHHQDQLFCQLILEECPIDVLESMLSQGLQPEKDAINFAAMRGRHDIADLLIDRGLTFSTDFGGIDQLVRWNPDIEQMDAIL